MGGISSLSVTTTKISTSLLSTSQSVRICAGAFSYSLQIPQLSCLQFVDMLLKFTISRKEYRSHFVLIFAMFIPVLPLLSLHLDRLSACSQIFFHLVIVSWWFFYLCVFSPTVGHYLFVLGRRAYCRI